MTSTSDANGEIESSGEDIQSRNRVSPQIGFLRGHGFIQKPRPKFGFNRFGFNSTRIVIQSTVEPKPATPRNLHDVLRAAVSGIKSHSLRREMVNRLYEVRGKKAFVEESYLANYEVPDGHFHKDITFVSGKPYRNQIDLFVGGSPCQSFSFVGHQGGFEDARGTLFYDFVRLVDDIQPKMFIGKTSRGFIPTTKAIHGK